MDSRRMDKFIGATQESSHGRFRGICELSRGYCACFVDKKKHVGRDNWRLRGRIRRSRANFIPVTLRYEDI